MTGVWVGCRTGYGDGGLGQHLAQLVEDARKDGQLGGYYCHRMRPGDDGLAVEIADWIPNWAWHWTPLRFNPDWRSFGENECFDRAVAAAMVRGPTTYFGFVGQALHSFRRARRLGVARLGLMAANSHVLNVQHLHRRAINNYGLERSWLNSAQVRKTLREYEVADVIHVASNYTMDSFLEHGVPRSKLCRQTLNVHPRYRPAEAKPGDGIFRIVFTGSVTVVKGVPVLLEAFSRLPVKEAQLTLVGGTSSRGMRRYLEAAMARDPRIRLAPGDPLPHLQQADVYVHPSYEDGFGYAPAEALACGVPVIVTEDTGMKELVREGETGYVVPTGDSNAIIERLLEVRHTRSSPALNNATQPAS